MLSIKHSIGKTPLLEHMANDSKSVAHFRCYAIAPSTGVYAPPSLEKERIDHQILNPIFSGTEPDRDTLAEYQIHLAAFFCISVPECLGRCVGKHPEKLWVKMAN